MNEQFTAEQWGRVSALLDEALDLAPERRGAFVAQACGSDADLRRRLEALLAASAASGDFLDEPDGGPAAAVLRELAAESREQPAAEQIVGRWRLVSELGRGGMGVVWLAQRADQQFDQRAALKLIKRGLDTDEILHRFRRERQILARLQHPNIARLLDGGATEDGRPWFAMEHVEGLPIQVYCDRERLTVDDRLRLFRTICDAVAYAHANLIVHRDLKPGNILVTPRGEVKLLDFGIARLLESEAATQMTREGMRPMTPEYAAPEQLRGEASTTATDVYGLGVVLYELLTGRRPHPLDGRTPAEFERAVLHTDAEPPSRVSPSGADSGSPAAESADLPNIAERRRTNARRLRRRLAGDLDTIVLTALRRDPARRYGSAEALGQDLERHLGGLPIGAHRDSLGYRARRFVGRHRLSVAAAALVIAALVFGLAATLWQAREARRQALKADQIKDFLIGVFQVADPSTERGEQVTAGELLRRGAGRIGSELERQPAVQVELFAIVGKLFHELGLLDEAEENLRQSLAIANRIYRGDHPDTAQAADLLGMLLFSRGDLDGARELVERGLEMRRRLFGDRDPRYADSLTNLAVVVGEQGDHETQERLHREAWGLDLARFGERHPSVATDLVNLGASLSSQGRAEEAESFYRSALNLRLELFGPKHILTATSQEGLAAVLTDLGRYDEAQPLYREALATKLDLLGPDHPEVGYTYSMLSAELEASGHYGEALNTARMALEIRERSLGRDHVDYAASANNLAIRCFRLGDFECAARYFREALDVFVATLGDAHESSASTLNNLGVMERELGRLDSAEDKVRRALVLRRAIHGDDHPGVSQGLRNLGLIFTDQGRLAAAADVFAESLAIARRVYPEDHPRLAEVLVGAGRNALAGGRPEIAEPWLEEAVAIVDAKFEPGNPRTLEARLWRAACGSALGRHADAEARLREVLALLERQFGETGWQAAEARVPLAAALAGQGRVAEARVELDAALEALTRERGPDHPMTRIAAQARSALESAR